MAKSNMSRRDFLRLSAVSAAAAVSATQLGRSLVMAQDTAIATYNEAPMLRTLVDAGQLPPVNERLPKNPLVIDVHEEIGEYGGTLRRAYSGVSDRWGPSKMVEEYMVKWHQTPDGDLVLLPHVAESVEVNDDATEYTFFLREGTRWSDGTPLTTEDARFWYEDLYANEEVAAFVGGNSPQLSPGGEKMRMEILDDYSFKVIFSVPNPFLLMGLSTGLAAHGSLGPNFMTPSHYFKQFHPSYATEEEVQAVMDRYQIDTWQDLFTTFESPAAYWYLNPEVPTVHGWVTKEAPPANRIVYERNPYYFAVDPAGNQLPYIDEMTHELFDNSEVLNFKIINGEIDLQNRHITPGNFTLYKENEATGNYRTVLWRDALTHGYHFNVAYDGDAYLSELFNDVRFRHALSVAIDREEVNNLVFNGLAVPRQASPVNGSPQHDPEWEAKWIEYDPETSNQLLDEIGLTQRDSEGFRVRPDGGELTLILEYQQTFFGSPSDMHELVRDYWGQVGIRLVINGMERSLYQERRDANEMMLGSWVVDRSAVVPANPSRYTGIDFGGAYYVWYSTNGEQGLEPPADHPIREVWALWEEAASTGDETRRNAVLQQMLDVHKEQIWLIGVVGEPPAIYITNNNLGNVPEGFLNDDPLRNEGLGVPVQFFYRPS